MQVDIWLCSSRRYSEGHTEFGADQRILFGSCISSESGLAKTARPKRLHVVAGNRLYDFTVSFAETYHTINIWIILIASRAVPVAVIRSLSSSVRLFTVRFPYWERASVRRNVLPF